MPGKSFHFVHLLAILAVPIMIWEIWTIIAWFADGPRLQVNDFGTTSWYAARVFELLSVIVSIIILRKLIREARRADTFFTFDIMYCLAGATIVWASMGSNIVRNVFIPSGAWIHFSTSMCGYMPLINSPHCRTLPDPVIVLWLLEIFGALAASMLIQYLVKTIRQKFHLHEFRYELILTIILGIAICLPEIFVVAFGLWDYPTATHAISFANGNKYPILHAMIGFGGWFVVMAAIRNFKDENGLSILERNLDHHSLKVRKLITFAALYTYFQLAAWFVANSLFWLL